jgi:hypothetical protein
MSNKSLYTKYSSNFPHAVLEHTIGTPTGFGNFTHKCDRFNYIMLICMGKVKVSLQHVVKVHRGSTGMAVLIINLGAR